CYQINDHQIIDYQIIFTANCTSRAVVVVLDSKPATSLTEPVESKISLLSGVVGGAKLAWFIMLKISARNCTLKFSEILLMWLFLNTEKSKFVMPGPIKIFRPALPRRLKHCSELESPPTHFDVRKARSGAVGIGRHCVLM